MDRYYSMFETLEGLNLYKLMGNTVIDAELWAYSAGLSLLGSAIDEFVSEINFTTAQTWGFSRNGYFPWMSSNNPLLRKQQMYIGRSSIRNDDFSVKGMAKCLTVIGVTANIYEQPGGTSVLIKVIAMPSGMDVTKVRTFAEEHLSAHLEFQVEK